MTPRFVAWVRHEHVAAWLALGWDYGGVLPGRHGEWSAALEWLCDCKVRRPNKMGVE
jgi:hypothetical protein